MNRSVFPNRKAKAALAKQVVPVVLDIDGDRNEDPAWCYKVREVPTLILIDTNGKVLDRGGFMSAKALVSFLRRS